MGESDAGCHATDAEMAEMLEKFPNLAVANNKPQSRAAAEGDFKQYTGGEMSNQHKEKLTANEHSGTGIEDPWETAQDPWSTPGAKRINERQKQSAKAATAKA